MSFRLRLTYVYIYTGGFTVSSEISKEFLYQVELNRDRYIAERRIEVLNKSLRHSEKRFIDWNKRLDKAIKLDLKDDIRKWNNCVIKEKERIDDINRQLVILYRVLKTIGEANYEYFKE